MDSKQRPPSPPPLILGIITLKYGDPSEIMSGHQPSEHFYNHIQNLFLPLLPPF